MTQETREQFRERIGRVTYEAWQAYSSPNSADEAPGWEDQCVGHHAVTIAGAKAVYAAALRDVRALLLRETDWCQECGGGVYELDAFAASLGIDLEDK